MAHDTFRAGDLTAVIGDNAAAGMHRAGYNGVWSLVHKNEAANLFVPVVAGLNFEHIFDGDKRDTDGSGKIFFEPRNQPMAFKKISDTEAALHQEPTPTFHLESWTTFKLVAPHYLDMTFRCRPTQHVFAHGYLLVGGEKMSKSKLNQIAPADLVADFGVDGFRYHFLADQRFGPDGDFSYEAMVARYNADLANNFGNLANRVLNMAVNYCDGVVPAQRADGALVAAVASAFAAQTTAFERLDIASAFAAVWELIGAANAYIEDAKPWALNKAGDSAATAAVIGDCLETLRVVALLASPAIPRASAELWRRLGLPGSPTDQRLPDAVAWGGLPAGASLEKGAPLFPRIET